MSDLRQDEIERKLYTTGFYVGTIIQYSLALMTNSVIFVLLVRTRKDFKTLGFGFILVLAVSDFINALHRIPLALFDMEVFGFYQGTEFLAWFCPLTSTLTVLCPFLAALSAMLLSVERYWQVCLRQPLSRRTGWCWFFGLGALFAIPVAASSMTMASNLPTSDPELLAVCFPPLDAWRRIRNHMYYIMLTIFLCVLTFCYINIFLTTKRNVMKTTANPITRRVAIRVFVFLGVYLFCYIPMVASYAIYMNRFHRYILIEYICTLFNGFISLIDPALVLFLHRRYRNEFFQLVLENRPVCFLTANPNPTKNNH